MAELYKCFKELKIGEKYAIIGKDENGCDEKVEFFFIHSDFAKDLLKRYSDEQDGIRDALYTLEEQYYFIFLDEECAKPTYIFIDNSTGEMYMEEETENFDHFNPAKALAETNMGKEYKRLKAK